MATSILVLNDHHAKFNDVDLLLVVRMVLSSMTDHDRQRLPALKEAWERAIATSAPGVVDLPVQEYANHSDTRAHLVALLSNFQLSLSAWGDEVPLEQLKNCRIPGVRFNHPYPTRHLVDATKQLQELIVMGGPVPG